MVKKRKGSKEKITPPRSKLLTEESKKLRAGDPGAGRILSEEAQAVRQRVRKAKKP